MRHFWSNLLDIAQCLHFWWYSTVYAEELPVQQGHQWQSIKHFHADVEEILGEFTETLGAKSKMLRQVATLVIAAQHVQRVGVVDLLRG